MDGTRARALSFESGRPLSLELSEQERRQLHPSEEVELGLLHSHSSYAPSATTPSPSPSSRALHEADSPLPPQSQPLPGVQPDAGADTAAAKARVTVSAVEDNVTKSQPPKGIWYCIYATVAVFVVNLGLTITAGVIGGSKENGLSFHSATLYRGSCAQTQNTATGLRVVINVLAAVLVATTSYGCQVLTAPSREAVDKAHAERRWLAIGTLSVRNLLVQSRFRVILWVLLFVTSVPIQLVYNSMIYVSVGASTYGVVIVPPDFTDPNSSLDNFPAGQCFNDAIGWDRQSLRESVLAGNFQTLGKEDCIEAYGAEYITNRRTLVIVSADPTSSDNASTAQPLLWGGYGYPAPTEGSNLFRPSDKWLTGADITGDLGGYGWMCGAYTNLTTVEDGQTRSNLTYPCEKEALLEYSDTWTVLGVDDWSSPGDSTQCIPASQRGLPASNGTTTRSLRVDHCLSSQTLESCELLLNPSIALPVLLCTLLKLLVLSLTTRSTPPSLHTIGDAIASFLQRPDPTTAGDCMLSTHTLRNRNDAYPWTSYFPLLSFSEKPAIPPLPAPPHPYPAPVHRLKWQSAPNPARWVIALVLSIICFILGAELSKAPRRSPFQGSRFSHPFTKPITPETLLTNISSSTTSLTLFTNLFHLVLTALYLLYNDMLTRMLLSSEYQSYSRIRAPLRKSHTSLHLSLPLSFSLPLLSAFTIIHWLLAQGLSLAQISPRGLNGEISHVADINVCAVSPLSLVIAILVGVVTVCVILGLTQKRFVSSSMPFAKNCTAVVSAACHPIPAPVPVPGPYPYPGKGTDENTGVEADAGTGAGAGNGDGVMWGEMIPVEMWPQQNQNQRQQEGFFGPPRPAVFRHCGFSRREVGTPRADLWYA